MPQQARARWQAPVANFEAPYIAGTGLLPLAEKAAPSDDRPAKRGTCRRRVVTEMNSAVCKP